MEARSLTGSLKNDQLCNGDTLQSNCSFNDGDNKTSQFDRLPDSDHYLQKLESRLSRLKGKGKELNTRDMIAVLQSVKDDHMGHLIQVDSANHTTSFLPEMDADDKDKSVSYIERKLFPEKNALTYEELQHLLEADVLAKSTMEECNPEIINEKGIDR